MELEGIQIAVVRDYPDSYDLGEYAPKKKKEERPVRVREAKGFRDRILPKPVRVKEAPRFKTRITPQESPPTAAIDGAPATDEEKAAQDALDEGGEIPAKPPTLSRQTAEEPASVPHIHSRLDFAPFAASAYEAPGKREDFMTDYTGRDSYYSYIPANSNEELATYMGTDGSLVIAIRGTATPGDVQTDKSILTGNPIETPRFRRNIQTINRIIATMGVDRDHVILTGHSLGGSIGAAASVALGVKAVIFNPGFSPASLLRDPYAISGKYRNADITSYTVPGDAVSLTSTIMPLLPPTYAIERTATGSSIVAPHKMDNFLNQLGDFKRERGDLYAPGARTEGRTRNVTNGWIQVPKRVPTGRKTRSKFTGGIGQPLPTPPTLWQILTGGKPPKTLSDADRLARAATTARDFRNILRPPRLDIPEFGEPIDEPVLDLGPEEDLELGEAIEDIIGLGETAAELGLLP